MNLHFRIGNSGPCSLCQAVSERKTAAVAGYPPIFQIGRQLYPDGAFGFFICKKQQHSRLNHIVYLNVFRFLIYSHFLVSHLNLLFSSIVLSSVRTSAINSILQFHDPICQHFFLKFKSASISFPTVKILS